MSTKDIDSAVIERIIQEVTEGQGSPEAGIVLDENIEVKEFELQTGKRKYSDLFGKSFTGREHNITVFKPEDWPEEMRVHIPDINPGYVFQPEATEKLAVGIEFGDKILFTGPTGSGKSTLVEQFCAHTNRPFIRINMTGDMETSAFFGMLTVEDAATVWKDGSITEATRQGAVALVDEWELSPPEIMMGLQWLLEDNGKLLLKEKPGDASERTVIPHKEFRLVMGGNTLGQGDISGAHAGVNVQNTATLDRFQTVIKLDYLERKHEIQLVSKAVPGLPMGVITKMIKFAGVLRTAYRQGSVSLTMSPRTLINWGRKSMYWGDPVVALKMVFFDKIEDSEKEVVNNLVNKVFAQKIV